MAPDNCFGDMVNDMTLNDGQNGNPEGMGGVLGLTCFALLVMLVILPIFVLVVHLVEKCC